MIAHPSGTRVQLDQIKAVITGGVSGLGLAVARLFAERGASVALVDIDDEKGAAAIAALGGKASYHPAPMSHKRRASRRP